MNEYDDLFFQQPKTQPLPPKKPQDDLEESSVIQLIQSKIKNVWMVLLYFILTILISGLSVYLLQDAYPNETAILTGISTTEEFSFTVEASPDGVGYRLTMNGEVKNNNPSSILSYVIDFEFFNSEGKSIGSQRLSKNDFEANSTWVIENVSFTFIEEPVTFAKDDGLRLPNTWTILLLFGQSIILSILFFVIDWKYVAHSAQRFYRRFGYHVGLTLLGFIAVIGVLILSQTILQLFNITDTPNNELAIQSLFEPNVLNLILLFFTLCILTPIVEEIIYRKVLFGFIEPKFGPWAAIIGSSVIFGFMHVTTDSIIQIIPYLMMGLVFGYIYHYTKKNVIVTMGMHFLNNFFVFLVYVAPLILGGLLQTTP